MKPPGPDNDDTVRLPPRRRRALRGARLLVVGAAVLGILALGGAATWLVLPRQPTQATLAMAPPVLTPAAPSDGGLAFPITVATEADISGHVPTALTVFRFAANPRVLVLDFPSLHEQGKMLNRVAAFVEKAGVPHDRVLSNSELDAAIRSRGDTVETFYFGHDYSAAALTRFFTFADAQGIELDPQEERLRALLRQEGWLTPGMIAGLISLPAVGSDPRVTGTMRSAILRHELSHGEFFSNPQYAEYVHNFWLNQLTGEERGAVRAFLGRNDYDVREETIMFNEMQAYLMFTQDPTFFTSDKVGMTPARLAELRKRFLAGMPTGWLRDVLAASQ